MAFFFFLFSFVAYNFSLNSTQPKGGRTCSKRGNTKMCEGEGIILRHLKADLHQAISLSCSVGSPNIRYILENRGFKYTKEGYLYHLKANYLLIKSNLEKIVSNSLSGRKNLFEEYNKQKERGENILKLNPKEIKSVPFLFGGKVKEENTKAERFNKHLCEAKEI